MSDVTIYAVTCGEYSDYEVLTLCSTRELAQELVDKYKESGQRILLSIEEHTLDAYRDHTFVKVYCVTLDKNGTFEKQWDFMMLVPSGSGRDGSGHAFYPGFRGRSFVSFGDAQRLAFGFFEKYKEAEDDHC